MFPYSFSTPIFPFSMEDEIAAYFEVITVTNLVSFAFGFWAQKCSPSEHYYKPKWGGYFRKPCSVSGCREVTSHQPPHLPSPGTSARNRDRSRFGSYYQTSSRAIEVLLEKHKSKMFAKYRVTIFSDILIIFIKIHLCSSGVSTFFWVQLSMLSEMLY